MKKYYLLLIAILTINIANAQWQHTNLNNNYSVLSLAISGNNIFAGTYGKGVCLSTNNGSSWDTLNPYLASAYVNSFAINGNNIFAGTNNYIYIYLLIMIQIGLN